MAEQQYEYRQLNPDVGDVHDGELANRINALAEEGWVLDERYTWQGSMISLIFRRPVE